MPVKNPGLFLAVCLGLALPSALADFERYPRLITKEGNVIFEAGINKNFTIRLNGRSRLLVNDFDLLDVLAGKMIWTGNSTGPPFDNLKLQTLVESINTLQNGIFGRGGLRSRMDAFQNRTQTMNQNLIVRRIQRRVSNLENRMNTLNSRLRTDNCLRNPCENGGACYNVYNGFKCKCVKGFEGRTCSSDVNECTLYAGTDLGCQNGAQCINQFGSYACICSAGWQGIHCNQRKTDCMHSSSTELCGHGTCVNTNDNFGYRCICEQGWKTNGLTPACNVDVDECREFVNSCTTKCINMPGGFMCSPCEAGLTGNGLVCKDIDECATDNGGCSVSPFVPCINSFGSFHCGECPVGWTGDGRVCTRSSGTSCTENICAPMALCSEISNRVVCQCPIGMVGNGVGPNGCMPARTTLCNPNPCLNGGSCLNNGNGTYTCLCPVGFRLPNCARAVNPCDANPCRNGGICRPQGNVFSCSCLPGYIGRLCDTQRSRCGEYITANEGVLRYPPGSQYNHNAQCSWVIRADDNKALNITFTMFDIEGSMECRFDWLQIHDGPTAASQLIGRFCGSRAPLGGNIITTANRIYLWFKSDNSTARAGFALKWAAIDPICGGLIEFDSHTTIASPGSPGNYPPNRTCRWHLKAPSNKRIHLVFFSLKIETHADCDHDFLEIKDAISRTRLEIFCNSSSPTPLTVPSNEIFIDFHSDGEGSDLGFQIFASTVERIPGCGGTYTDRQGEISSPTDFGGLVSCEYFVRYPRGIQVQLEVTEFKMGEEECLEILEIGSTDGNKTAFGRWCGKTNVPTFTSVGNNVQINFYSKGGTFKLSYREICHYTFEDPTGVITSPNYPTAYPTDETCVYEIIGAVDQVVSLEFTDMDIEGQPVGDCAFDFIVVDDGTNATAAGPFCGTTIPPKIVSSSSWLKITMKSDKNIVGRGFKANYTLVSTGRKCGGIMRKSTGEIRLPQSGKYEHDLTCMWTVFAPTNYGIQLTWISMDLESSTDCVYDSVEIFDTEKITPDVRSLGRFCGSALPPAIVSASSVLTLKFQSDSSEARDGFLARYTFVDTTKLCGGNLYSSTGRIMSPDFPYDYPNNADCAWTIHVQHGNQMELIVQTMDIEESLNCTNDWLELRNGGSEQSPLIGRYCGKNIPRRFPSFTHQIYIRFKSNAQITKIGFQIEWQSIASGCGGVVKADHGSIASPFYPQNYQNDAQCEWIVTVNKGSTIRFTFEDLSLENYPSCDFDSIEIFDGPSPSSARIIRLCEMTQTTFETTANSALIRFQSDSSATESGFYLNYVSNCNRQLNSTQGIIESPNFGENNPSEVNCTWTIKAPKGNRIILEFDIVGHKDFGDLKTGVVYVRESKNNTVIKVVNAKRYEFQAEWVEVSLNSSSTYFRMEYAIQGCVGNFYRETGGFTSPQYPQFYPNDVGCLWYIEAEVGKAIEVVFSDVDIEQSVNCTKDSIQIWNTIKQWHPIAKVCGNRQNVTFTSTGNTMFIQFTSDAAGNRKGFNATYRVIPAKCGGVMAFSKGTLHSPNYPYKYDASLNCEWLIEASPHSTLNFTLEELDIENSYRCFSDSLTIVDGVSKASPSSENKTNSVIYCGEDLPENNVFLTTSNKATVIFSTDLDVQLKGFKLSFKENCGKRIEVNETGRLRFQGSDETNCSWVFIAADRTSHVTFTTTHSAIRPLLNIPEDYCNGVKIFDGDFVNTTTTRPRMRFCSHHPPPYTSFGHALTITLDPQIISEFEGFYSVMDGSCGGEYTSLSGTFTSPSYPLSYPVNVECIWKIVASPGNSLTLTVQSLDLETSDECNNDYLEVRSGSSEGALLAVLCGNNVPSPIRGLHSLWIKFKSDNDHVGKGFIASYNYAFESEVNGTDGVIESPRFPNLFTSQTEHSWRIIVPRSQRILVAFTNFDSLYEDSLKIYNGYDEDVEQIEMPEDKIIRSNSNFLFLKASKGIFRLNWYQVSAQFIAENKTRVDNAWNCSNVILEISTVFTEFKSPGYPSGYESNMNCSWILYPVDYGSHAMVSFKAIDLENHETCSMDRVVVHSSSDMKNWKTMSTQCKLPLRQTLEIAGDRFLKVEFLTDYGVNGTGFLASAYSQCGSVLTLPTGSINTKIYKSSFMLDCTWNIRVKSGRRVKLTFEDSYLFSPNDTTQGCSSYVLLKNGFSEDSPNLGKGKYCDNSFGDALLTSSNEAYLKVHFRRDLNIPWISFRYEEVMHSCENAIELDEAHPFAIIKSDNYPNIPHAHSTCTWKVKAPYSRSIQIDFTQGVQLGEPCDLEYVALYDGSTELAPLIGRFCGKSRPNTQYSSSNLMRITHFTDIAEPNAGFIANVSLSLCGGTYRESQGSFSSPQSLNFVTLKPGFSCDYVISLPGNNDIDLTIDSLDLPSSTNCSTVNHLQIFLLTDDEEESNYTLLTRCGSSSDQNFLLEASKVLIKLVMVNSNLRSNSFQISYKGIGNRCGEVVEEEEGYLKSPGFLKALAVPTRCMWKLKVPKGRKVKLEFLEFNIFEQNSDRSPRIQHQQSGMYIVMPDGLIIGNDWEMRSEIARFNRTPSEPVYSTDNLMAIYSFESPAQQKRGFRARFTSSEETELCNANFQTVSGFVHFEPQGNNSVFCRYDIDVGTNETVSLIVEKVDASLKNRFLCVRFSPITIQDSAKKLRLQPFCSGNRNETNIRLPFSGFVELLKSHRNSLKSLDLKFSRHSCGGVFTIGQNFTVTEPVILHNNYGALDCAWQVLPNPGDLEQFEITLSVNFTLNCDEQYLTVYTDSTMTSPRLGRFCKQATASNLVATKGVFIEYHTSDYERGSTFVVTAVVGTGCGGMLSFPYRAIDFRKQYKNNVECIWTVTAGEGYHIALNFSGRFFIESNDNCTKDYLLVQQLSEGNWTDLYRLCGRNAPLSVETTTPAMRLVFRSDDSGTGDGFTANFKRVCGGEYIASREIQQLSSPNYPKEYDHNLNCTYTIAPPKEGKAILLQIKDFNLETAATGDCAFDYLEVYLEGEKAAVLCGQQTSKEFRSLTPIKLVFRTDDSFKQKGFLLQYSTEQCGGDITNTTTIQTPKQASNNMYPHNAVCTWIIKAPEGSKIVIKFERLEFEGAFSCAFDHVHVYTGLKSVPDQLVARLCGNLTGKIPPLIINSNLGLIESVSDQTEHSIGFSAVVRIVKMCDNVVQLDRLSDSYTISNFANGYENNLDCGFLFKTVPGQKLRVEFGRFHVDDTNQCQDDFVQILDGGGLFADEIGRFCGHTVPPVISSSRATLYLRFVTDSLTTSSGFTATVKATPMACGNTDISLAENKEYTIVMRGNGNYDPNLNCLWRIRSSGHMTLSFQSFDLQGPNANGTCDTDYVKIYIKMDMSHVERGINAINGDSVKPFIDLDGENYEQYLYCGQFAPGDLSVPENEVYVRFFSDSSIQRSGFKLRVVQSSECMKNYTATQGRIYFTANKDCKMYITAPANYSISLYFTSGMFPSRENCTQSSTEVFDMRDASLSKPGVSLRKLCGIRLAPTDSVFTSTNKLMISMTTEDTDQNVDITFLASDKGPGCGGDIFNTEGVFTSPFFPQELRNNSDCRWNIRVPHLYAVRLEFLIFDLGSKTTCHSDYLEIIESGSTDDVVRKYCGEDEPKVYVSSNSIVSVHFRKTVNFAGMGWVISFTSVHNGNSMRY